MNQEAIDSLRAEYDSAHGLLDMAMDERDHFLKQRDALAAENKVLRDALEIIAGGIYDTWTNGHVAMLVARAALTKEATNG